MAINNKIVLISTGGTIAGHVAKDKTDSQKIRRADDFSEIIQPTISYFKEKWNVNIEIESFELCNMDSSDILPMQWVELVNLIVKNYDNCDSFIITHGTNTMGYTCAALSFALANLNKPVILTGAQIPYGIPGSDALTNLNNAIRLAIWPYEPAVKGIVAVFGSHIISGTRVMKNTEFDIDPFQSFTTASIGRIGRIINLNADNVKKHNGYLETKFYNRALTSKDLIVESDFDMKIVSLTEFPGMSKDIFTTLVEKNEIKGFIFRAFGAGDVSNHVHESFEYLKHKKIPIVVSTQAPNGNSNLQVNQPGYSVREKDLAIPAYDMSIESQTTKLAWLLAKKEKGKLTYDDIKREMVTDYHGEINVLLEKKQ